MDHLREIRDINKFLDNVNKIKGQFLYKIDKYQKKTFILLEKNRKLEREVKRREDLKEREHSLRERELELLRREVELQQRKAKLEAIPKAIPKKSLHLRK